MLLKKSEVTGSKKCFKNKFLIPIFVIIGSLFEKRWSSSAEGLLMYILAYSDKPKYGEYLNLSLSTLG